MYTTYHLSSAQEINADIIEAIKTTFKSKPITIIVEEDGEDYDLSDEMKNILDKRLLENDDTFITADKSIEQLKKRYGL
jgi:hypothetical protein